MCVCVCVCDTGMLEGRSNHVLAAKAVADFLPGPSQRNKSEGCVRNYYSRCPLEGGGRSYSMGGWRERFARVCVCLSVGEGGVVSHETGELHSSMARTRERRRGGSQTTQKRGKMEYRSWF